MTRIQRIAAAAACALSLAFPASAQLIGSGHVMGNGTSSPRTPTDTPLGQVLNQSGSGIAKAGNTNTLATVSGVIPNGHCWSTDANHNAIDAGGACTVGGGGGTVNAGATPQFAYYGSTGNVVSGMALANPLLGPNVNNVLAYGADPTGTTDATSAFNAAAAAAIAGGTGSSVFVPCGTYLVTPGMDWVIPSPGSFAFIGGGVDCAILKATAPTTTLLEIEYAGSQSELTLGGVTFATGNASTTSRAIFLKSNVTTQAQNFAGSTIDRIGRRGDTGYGQGHYWGYCIYDQAVSNINTSNINSAGIDGTSNLGFGVQVAGTATGCGTPTGPLSICYATNINFYGDMFYPVGAAGIVDSPYS